MNENNKGYIFEWRDSPPWNDPELLRRPLAYTIYHQLYLRAAWKEERVEVTVVEWGKEKTRHLKKRPGQEHVTLPELMKAHDVGKKAIRYALDWLEERGYIKRWRPNQRVGTLVTLKRWRHEQWEWPDRLKSGDGAQPETPRETYRREPKNEAQGHNRGTTGGAQPETPHGNQGAQGKNDGEGHNREGQNREAQAQSGSTGNFEGLGAQPGGAQEERKDLSEERAVGAAASEALPLDLDTQNQEKPEPHEPGDEELEAEWRERYQNRPKISYEKRKAQERAEREEKEQKAREKLEQQAEILKGQTVH